MSDVLRMPADATRTERWDRAGVVVSTACAVHCTPLPLVAGLLPILGLQRFADERIEMALIAITALIGVVGHARAYRLHHRHVGPGLLFVTGLLMIIVTRLSQAETVIEPVALGCGGAFAAAAHWMNLRLCRCCNECGSAAPEG
jgi:MerC mercury resistance protein